MNTNSNQYPDMVCIITYLSKPFRSDFSKVEVKRVYAKTLDFNYFETRKLDVLRIRISNGIRITKYFEHTPRTILETLWK